MQVSSQRTLTAYDFACGYVEKRTNPATDTEIKLYGDMHHTCYWVSHYNPGRSMGAGYVCYSQSYINLKDARHRFNQLVKSEQCS